MLSADMRENIPQQSQKFLTHKNLKNQALKTEEHISF